MMTGFYETGSVLQILLLICSQLTVISLAVGIIFLFKRKCGWLKLAWMSALLLLNIAQYVLMQINSRITGVDQRFLLHTPFAVLLLVTLLSLAVTVLTVLSETQNRKTINQTSIKEAFDNLPTGVCFFNEEGLPVLCNLAMYRFSFAVSGKDVQFITDLEGCLADDFAPVGETRKDGRVFILPNGSAWHLEKRTFDHESGAVYTQFVAADVSDLHENRVELMRENAQLRKVQTELQQLSANVVTITREEEILNTKMRVHDEMGRCLVAAQKYLDASSEETIPDSVATSWQRAVSMLKYNNDAPDEDMLSQIRKTCEFVELAFIQTGELPKQEDVAYLLTCAVRECVTNAVRYAGADKLYADFSENESTASVTVTNSGKAPEREIVEGGGLSTLRRRVEQAGGKMTVQSLPHFKLTVTVPKGKDGVL